jgi:hypothetical protein
MVLWQITQLRQNCVDILAADHHRHQFSNQPPTIPTTWNNSNIGVYDSEFKGESEYQLYFSIEVIVLWRNAKHQNYIGDGAADHHQFGWQ